MSKVAKETAVAAEAQYITTGHEDPPNFVALALGSVGVVYGDIGTSPLYAFREAVMAASNQTGVTRDVVLGVLSLIVWALIITVTLKYVLLQLRADNNGEGGTLSLTALATRIHISSRCHRRLDVSRRFRDHAGDLGTFGGRGA
jgi:KUP system potassium uptake protein